MGHSPVNRFLSSPPSRISRVVPHNPVLSTGIDAEIPDESFAPSVTTPEFRVMSLPVWNFPSAASEAFDYVQYINLPAVGASAVIISFRVPEGRNGIIKRLGNAYVGSGFTEGSGSLQWQLLHAPSTPITNYENIPASLGATAAPSEVSSIRIKENELIQLIINNLSLNVGGAFAGGRIGGWFYPKNEEPADSYM